MGCKSFIQDALEKRSDAIANKFLYEMKLSPLERFSTEVDNFCHYLIVYFNHSADPFFKRLHLLFSKTFPIEDQSLTLDRFEEKLIQVAEYNKEEYVRVHGVMGV